MDLANLTGKELNTFLNNTSKTFKEFLPFKAKNGVCLEYFILAIQAPRGLLVFDNGYLGVVDGAKRYYLTLRYSPEYSRLHKYSSTMTVRKIDAMTLDDATRMIERTDKQFAKDLQEQFQ